MDLFDTEKHFSLLVPLRALRDAMLRNAIAAVAAKQLGKVKGRQPFVGEQCQRPSVMETFDSFSGLEEIDWFYKAANYYDKAIAASRAYLQALSGSLSQPASPDNSESGPVSTADDLLVAVSLFTFYESLDNLEFGFGWLR